MEMEKRLVVAREAGSRGEDSGCKRVACGTLVMGLFCIYLYCDSGQIHYTYGNITFKSICRYTHTLTTSHIGPSETRGIWIKFWLCQCQFSWCGIVLQSFKMLSLGKRGWRVYEISLVFLTTAHKSTIISR